MIKNTLIILLGIASFILFYLSFKAQNIVNYITLPPFTYIDLGSYGMEYVTVKGTLATDEASTLKIGNILNSTEFKCDRTTGQCDLTQADISIDSGFLSTYTEALIIDSWDNNFITFSSNPNTSKCVIWTYRIDRLRQELVGIREKRLDSTDSTCAIIKDEKFVVRLVDGFKVIEKTKR